jgi:hypothetical protein
MKSRVCPKLRAKDHSDVHDIPVALPVGPLRCSQPNAIKNPKFMVGRMDSVI